jgi:hypothetical protein
MWGDSEQAPGVKNSLSVTGFSSDFGAVSTAAIEETGSVL